jgi:hypothetical protein
MKMAVAQSNAPSASPTSTPLAGDSGSGAPRGSSYRRRPILLTSLWITTLAIRPVTTRNGNQTQRQDIAPRHGVDASADLYA